jgi:hypothetical protein
MGYKVWECRIYVDESAKLPYGFDLPPRMGAIEVIENEGIEVKYCFSGWGRIPIEIELAVIEDRLPKDDEGKS